MEGEARFAGEAHGVGVMFFHDVEAKLDSSGFHRNGPHR